MNKQNSAGIDKKSCYRRSGDIADLECTS